MKYEDIARKVISLDEARALFSPEFRKDRTMVFTNGCFDIIHRGHVYYLARAREKGDLLVVGLNSDASVKRLKGEDRPVNDLEARAEVLGALGMVDYVIIFGEDTPQALIRALMPDVLVKGGDYRVEDIVGYEEVTGNGGQVLTIPMVKGYSTTAILKK